MSEAVAIFLDGSIYAAWLFLVAVGLTLVYGVMKIVNVAHGATYTVGAYAAVSLCGAWAAGGGNEWGIYLPLVLAAPVVGLILGPILERLFLRPLRDEEETVLMLVTYALFLILEDSVKFIWGVDPYFLSEPYLLPGGIDIFDLTYPVYNFGMLIAATVVGVGLAWFLSKSKSGRIVRAVIHDREVAMAMGANVDRIYLAVFSFGCALAALGGALTAPTVSVIPSMGVEVIVLAFAVVVIGGMGSIIGALLGALLVGFVRAMAVHLLPEAELFIIYLVMATVLLVRPSGLFAPAEARKI
ncbi:MAG: branched-chain amino acid ABC transporter permease [Betaproteobacteria bacterium]|jgi:branched-chain amino acid transport system permease protein|nr:branched-chain amino acid ABC transporter permease [Betaproteobacteria bacterium]NBY18256.1 branched-chain amino acid ABC transporter permease [Betaproteobacteria bacterium]